MDSPLIAQLISRAAEAKIKKSKYGYTPTTYVAFIFLALFGISTILHLGQAIRYRMWWLLPTACLCGVGELVGWGGRLWSSYSPTEKTPYMMQITTTIIAPTPLIAVSFILLGRLVDRLGPCYSRISPQWYSRIFVTCDFIALVVQGAGGGLAASADDEAGANMGARIMLGGIIFQAVAITVYTACAVSFLRAYSADAPVRRTSDMRARRAMEPNVRLMIYALAFSTGVLFIRSIYRIIELATGWHGKIIETEVYFNIFDGAMVVLAIYTVNLAHPGRLLAPPHADSYALPSSVAFSYRADSVMPSRLSQQTLIGGDSRIVEKSAV
ncbi:RTA1-like protein [Mycena belliarum]|uniref:RTA1-like protein n=1 Tax=Mycena belliarum TaxID=1033014 RepID=A0AAD6XHD9_9AGAR|nr:RTA1-like protein [Mycena belliae]